MIQPGERTDGKAIRSAKGAIYDMSTCTSSMSLLIVVSFTAYY